jgi:hypothetical protein
MPGEVKIDDRVKENITALSDEGLLAMFDRPGEYTPFALQTAQDELSRRGGRDGVIERMADAATAEKDLRRLAPEFANLESDKLAECRRAVLQARVQTLRAIEGLVFLEVILSIALGVFVVPGVVVIIGIPWLIWRKPRRMIKELGLSRKSVKVLMKDRPAGS